MMNHFLKGKNRSDFVKIRGLSNTWGRVPWLI
jgi:hypothetical protein